MVELMKIMVTSFKRSHAHTATLVAPYPSAGHRRLTPLPEILDTRGHVWVSFLWGHCSFLLGPSAHKVLFVPSKSLFPVLCKFWWFYGGVNGDLLQEGLCHTQVCCTHSPCSRQGAVCLSHLPCPNRLVFWVCHESTISDMPYVSPGELISGCKPPGGRCHLWG